MTRSSSSPRGEAISSSLCHVSLWQRNSRERERLSCYHINPCAPAATSCSARRRDGARCNSDAAACWMCDVGSGLSGWTAFRHPLSTAFATTSLGQNKAWAPGTSPPLHMLVHLTLLATIVPSP